MGEGNADLVLDAPSLQMVDQMVEDWLDAAYWRKVCPFLTVDRDTQREQGEDQEQGAADPPADQVAALIDDLNRNGFLCLSAETLSPLLHCDDLVGRLGKGVEQLIALGHSASSICVYDEHWELIRRLSPLLTAVTGNTPCGDIFTFHKSADPKHEPANTTSFGNVPHRDRPKPGAESFREDGAAKYCTVWCALTDATPASSCLYVIPKIHDPGYHLGQEALQDTIAVYENIQALPVDAGGCCVFSHRLVHWGSRPTANAPPRVALSYTLSDSSFEIGEFFSHARYSPFPPLELRVALRAAVSVLFCRQKPFPKGGLGLAMRLWRCGEHLFEPQFREKINGSGRVERFFEGQDRTIHGEVL